MKRKEPGAALAKTAATEVYYPIFVNLRKKKAVVIGGGRVAERKILGLLKAGADVTVISPKITKRIEREKLKGGLKHINRHYRNGDLTDAFLVIAATDSPVTNEKVSADAPCLVNVVDVPKLCNFIVPSSIIRDPLTIAVSTGGVSPALSRSIRKELEKTYGAEFSRYLKSLRKIRVEAIAAIPDKGKRSRILKALAAEKMLKILRGKGFTEAKKAAESIFNNAKNKN